MVARVVAAGTEEASWAAGDAPWGDVVRLRPRCGSSSPEVRPAALGRGTETVELPPVGAAAPRGGEVNSSVVLAFS